MIPLTPRSHSSITIPPPSPSKTNWNINIPYFWRIGWKKNKNLNKNPSPYQLIETKVPLMSKDVKALSQKKKINQKMSQKEGNNHTPSIHDTDDTTPNSLRQANANLKARRALFEKK